MTILNRYIIQDQKQITIFKVLYFAQGLNVHIPMTYTQNLVTNMIALSFKF